MFRAPVTSTDPALVAHVIAPGGIGGAESVVLRGVAALRGVGIDARIAAIREARAPDRVEALVARAQALGLPVEVITAHGRFDRRGVRDLRRLLRRWNATHVHVHGYKAALFSAATPRQVRFFATHHGQGGHGLRVEAYVRLSLLAYRRAERVFAVSEATRKHLIGLGVRDARIVTLHNLLSLDPTTPVTAPPTQETLSLAYVGRLSFEKGVDQLLRALAWTSSPISLTLVGDGPERGVLEGLVAEYGLDDRVRFVGFQPDVATFISSAHALVLPSRTEGLPMTMVEAMALGRPVIATAVGGVPEAFDVTLGGALVPPDDPGALAAALNALALNREASLAAAMAGAPQVRDRFAAERWARETARVYGIPPTQLTNSIE